MTQVVIPRPHTISREKIRSEQTKFATKTDSIYFNALDHGGIVAYVQKDLETDEQNITDLNLKDKIKSSIDTFFSAKKESIVSDLKDFKFDQFNGVQKESFLKSTTNIDEIFAIDKKPDQYKTLQKKSNASKKADMRKTISEFFSKTILSVKDKISQKQQTDEISDIAPFLTPEKAHQKEAICSIIYSYQDDIAAKKSSVKNELESVEATLLIDKPLDEHGREVSKNVLKSKETKLEKNVRELTELNEQYGSLLAIINLDDDKVPLTVEVIIPLLEKLNIFSLSLVNDNVGQRIFLGEQFFFYYQHNPILPSIHYAQSAPAQSLKSKQILIAPQRITKTLGDAEDLSVLAALVISEMGDVESAALSLTSLSHAHYTIHPVLTNREKLEQLKQAFNQKGYVLVIDDTEALNSNIPKDGNCLLESSIISLRNVRIIKKVVVDAVRLEAEEVAGVDHGNESVQQLVVHEFQRPKLQMPIQETHDLLFTISRVIISMPANTPQMISIEQEAFRNLLAALNVNVPQQQRALVTRSNTAYQNVYIKNNEDGSTIIAFNGFYFKVDTENFRQISSSQALGMSQFQDPPQLQLIPARA